MFDDAFLLLSLGAILVLAPCITFGSFASPAGAGTSRSCKEAFSEFVLGTHSALSSQACVTACTPEEPLNWGLAIKTSDDMVVIFSIDAFARDKLLAGRLAGCAVLGSAAPSSREKLSVLGTCQIVKDNLHERRSAECVGFGEAISNITLEPKP